MARRIPDLAPYHGCPADEALGYTPLGVGWLRGPGDLVAGSVPAGFGERLAAFCQPAATVCNAPAAMPCPLCRTRVPPYGGAEIRVIGEEEIFAAPDLVAHYVSTHNYAPPAAFVAAVLDGPSPGTPEHRALLLGLRAALGDA